MQCRDPGEVGGLGHVLGAPVGGLVADVVITAATDIGLVGLLGPVRLVVVVLILTVGVVLVLVAVIVLYKAEVDRHLPHGTGHPSVLPACTRLRQLFRPHAWDITGHAAPDRRATPYRFAGVSRQLRRRPRDRRSCRPRSPWRPDGPRARRPRSPAAGRRHRRAAWTAGRSPSRRRVPG